MIKRAPRIGARVRKVYRRRRRSELDLVSLLLSRLRVRYNATIHRRVQLFLSMGIAALKEVRRNVKVANYEEGRPVTTSRTVRKKRVGVAREQHLTR